MAKAEKRAAEDELTAYKDALKRQLIDNVKPEKRSVLDRLEKRSPSSGKKNRNKIIITIMVTLMISVVYHRIQSQICKI